MCFVLLPVQVEFRYWGLQSKVERFIHDYGLRRVMLRAHRQAWAWQDEWVGLTMEDIRRLERETQLILQRKLGRISLAESPQELEEEDVGEEESEVERKHSSQSADNLGVKSGHRRVEELSRREGSNGSLGSLKQQEWGEMESMKSFSKKRKSLSSQASNESGGGSSHFPERRRSSHRFKRDRESLRSTRSRRVSDSSVRTFTRGTDSSDMPRQTSHLQLSQFNDSSDDDSMYSTRPEWGFDQIAMHSDSGSDPEFFDAKGRCCVASYPVCMLESGNEVQ